MSNTTSADTASAKVAAANAPRPERPRPEFIAAQLRKPAGEFAPRIAQNMDSVNEPLFDLTLRCMDLAETRNLLEIGFGSGKFLPRLFVHHPHLKVTGVDYSPEMVSLAAMNNDDLIAAGRLTLQAGRSDDLPLADASFDAAFANMVIYFWDQPARDLREVRRVLTPGGTFYTGFRPPKSFQNAPFARFGFTHYEPEEWQAMVEKNSFRVTRIERRLDPVMETNGQKIQMESVCVVAQKAA